MRAAISSNRGAVDIAMIGLVRDARLRVSEAAVAPGMARAMLNSSRA